MPIYEYDCSRCGAHFEELVRSTREERDLTCPRCRSNQLTRKLSVFAPRGGPEAGAPSPGGCQRCGDPRGPCAAD